jgi:hypothetical protein
MYTSSQIGVKEITNLFLYGNIEKPQDINNAALIRPKGARPTSISYVQASISYRLGANLDNLELTDSAIDGSGNSLSNMQRLQCRKRRSLKPVHALTCRVFSDQSQLDFLASVDKSFFKPAMNSAGVR